MDTNLRTQWNHLKKWFFRFAFIYLIVYTFPFPLHILFPSLVDSSFLWRTPVQLTGELILQLDQPITLMLNGSGDTTFHYVQVFMFFLLAMIGSIIWSGLDWRRAGYARLYYWLVVLVRYYLAVVSIGYGFAKVIKTQFPFPFFTQLIKPVGDLSPMGLLWTFMGYSTAYNVFCGMAEVLGGMLLFFRRTTLLGALILFGVYLNIVVLNFSYDVPVKLYSSHLLLMCVFLIAPHVPRLWQFLVLHRPVAAISLQPVFSDTQKQAMLLAVKIVLLSCLIYSQINNGLARQDQLNNFIAEPSFSGIYQVDTFVLRGDTIPAILNNNVRWRRVVVGPGAGAKIEYMDGVEMFLNFTADTVLHSLRIASSPTGYGYEFQYAPLDSTHYLWKGLMGQDSLNLAVNKLSAQDFTLVNRRFHWINEYPYNR
jgi:hypothetical protein